MRASTGRPAAQVICGDALAMLSGMETGSIDAIVTDPPYGMRWDTNSHRYTGGKYGHRTAQTGLGRCDWGNVMGDELPFDPAPWLTFDRVVLWGCNHFAAALPIGTMLVWVKRNEAAYGSFLSDAEIAWMKGGHGVYLHKDLSMNAIASRRLHPTQKPVGLFCWCFNRLKLRSGMTVLDPYMGSGSVGVAALEAGLDFIGIEINPDYCDIARKRLAAVQPSLFDAPEAQCST